MITFGFTFKNLLGFTAKSLESDQKAIDQSTKEVDDLLRELEKSGKDIKDKKIQKDLIDKIIFAKLCFAPVLVMIFSGL